LAKWPVASRDELNRPFHFVRRDLQRGLNHHCVGHFFSAAGNVKEDAVVRPHFAASDGLPQRIHRHPRRWRDWRALGLEENSHGT